jgi:hypothetical protein
MPGLLVHVGALTACTHGGAVTVIVPSPRVFVSGMPVLSVADIPLVAGCSLTSPCVKVILESATHVFVGGLPASILTLAAACQSGAQNPQGPPVSLPIQKRVTAS